MGQSGFTIREPRIIFCSAMKGQLEIDPQQPTKDARNSKQMDRLQPKDIWLNYKQVYKIRSPKKKGYSPHSHRL